MYAKSFMADRAVDRTRIAACCEPGSVKPLHRLWNREFPGRGGCDTSSCSLTRTLTVRARPRLSPTNSATCSLSPPFRDRQSSGCAIVQTFVTTG
jgi:hypothetical protein